MCSVHSLRIPIISMLLLGACDSEICGPRPNTSPLARGSLSGQELVYEQWRSGANNDCGVVNGPVSLTVDATQMGVIDRSITLCLPRPDLLSGKTVNAGDNTLFQVIDVFADLGSDCLARLDRTRENMGTVAFHGICADGTSEQGYSLDLQLRLPMIVTCPSGVSDDVLSMTTSVAVSAISNSSNEVIPATSRATSQ